MSLSRRGLLLGAGAAGAVLLERLHAARSAFQEDLASLPAEMRFLPAERVEALLPA